MKNEVKIKTFQDLGLDSWIIETLENIKIVTPTEIQAKCIPQLLKGCDCIGGSKTGSGKTITFAAPMLSSWSRDPYGIYGVILTPSRELAMQILEQFSALGSTLNVRMSLIVGGMDITKQRLELQNKPHFVIATPGRLADHFLNGGEEVVNSFKKIKYLIFDEADILLGTSFIDDMERCLSVFSLSKNKQTCLFTATISDSIKLLKDKKRSKEEKPLFYYQVADLNDISVPTTLDLSYIFIPFYVKEAYLDSILSCEIFKNFITLIFVNRTKTAEILRRTLRKLNFKVLSLHSEMPQSERTNSLHRFKGGWSKILVATDVASRGLDISTINLVINYDIPADPNVFIHRVGRTARSGKLGHALTFVCERDVDRVLSIENRIGKKLVLFEEITDTMVVKNSLKKATVAKRESLMEMDKDNFGEKKKIIKKKKLKSMKY